MGLENGILIYDSASNTSVSVGLDGCTPDMLWSLVWSPNGTRLAVSIHLSDPHPNNVDTRTWVIDASTGDILDQVDWKIFVADPAAPPHWIDNYHLIFGATANADGPFMLTLGQGVIDIPTEIFGMDCSVVICPFTFAAATKTADGAYHLLLRETAIPPEHDWLYHSESGEIEDLMPGTYATFLTDESLLLNETDPANLAPLNRRVRPIDPPGSEAEPAAFPDGWIIMMSGSPIIFVSDESSLMAYDIDGQLLGEWWAEGDILDYGPYRSKVSPDGRHVLVVGSNRFYVLPLPEMGAHE